MKDKNDEFAERWVDASLEHFSDAEPRPGFETRLLATIAAEREKRSHWRGVWTWAAIATAAILVVAIALNVGKSREDKKPDVVAHVPTQSGSGGSSHAVPVPSTAAGSTSSEVASSATSQRPLPAGGRGARAIHPVRTAPNVQIASAPKQPQFPSPAPLSEQERLMLAYVRDTPKSEIENVIEQQQAFRRHVDSLGVPEEQEKSDR